MSGTAIMFALLLAGTIGFVGMLFHVATKALDGAILAHLRLNHEHFPGVWMKSSEFTFLFGGPVYPHLRRLVEAGLVEMCRRPAVPGDGRGGHDSFWYRWRVTGDGDQFMMKLETF